MGASHHPSAHPESAQDDSEVSWVIPVKEVASTDAQARREAYRQLMNESGQAALEMLDYYKEKGMA